MSEPTYNLFALAFDDEFKADEARASFKRMAGEGLLVLEETAVVVMGMDGKPTITQDADVTKTRRMQGHWLGIVAAAATGVLPLIMVGTVAGEVVGRMTDHGITGHMMKPIADSMTPGTSALFGFGKAHSDADRQKIVERIRHFNGTIVQTSVSPELRAQVEELLAQAPEPTTS
jgi:uncharacterized membrane protein